MKQKFDSKNFMADLEFLEGLKEQEAQRKAR